MIEIGSGIICSADFRRNAERFCVDIYIENSAKKFLYCN